MIGMAKLLSLMSGKKTYMLTVLTLVYAWSGFLTGNVDFELALVMSELALFGSTLRHGISTSTSEDE